MNLWDETRTVVQLARWAFNLVRHDTHYRSPVPGNPKFMRPCDAVKLIRDGDVVAESGLAAQQHASIIYWAIREAFDQTGHPRGLTLMNLGGHGGRGIAPGTLEELGRPGLCTRLITGHFETFQAMLDLAAIGKCELQCLPLGVMALLFDALGRGQTSLLTSTGVGTFLDPRVGPGTAVAGSTDEQLVAVEGHRLRYRIPKIDVAVFNVPAADRHGNLYLTHCATIGESREIARAAKRNHGRVIANVGCIIDEDRDRIYLPADRVDAVVYYPDTEQTVGVFHRNYWPGITTESDVPIAEGLAWMQFVNWLAGVTPRRTPADAAVAQLAAATLLANIPPTAYVNIGVGFPEQVCQVIFESGRLGGLTFLGESGVVGGLPAPGIYFGAALSPERIVSSARMFKLCNEKLDATCLGALQVDSHGNVNVSKRAPGPRGYVGPGGFIDLTEAAKTIVFVSAWMAHGEFSVDGGRLRLVKAGLPKFVDHVDEVTFNGRRAVEAGKRVFYATHVGLFRLTKRGMELVRVMPGIDIRRDILAHTAMRIVPPASGQRPIRSKSFNDIRVA
jgi:propionate CoA-transferase